jgi:ketosteroid isomerase-like protein
MLFHHKPFLYKLFLFVVIGTVFSLAPVAHADATTEARKAIQAAYDHMSAAVEKRELNGVTAFYTPDFEMTERGGTRNNLAASRRQIQFMLGMLKTIKATQVIQTFTLKGNQAVVTEHTHMDGIMLDPQTKRPHKFVGDNISQDIWIKGAKGWLQRRSQTLTERTTIDGKPQP